MSYTFPHARFKIAKGQLDLSSADLRMLLVMTGTSLSTGDYATSVATIASLNELDSTAGYARKTLAGEAVTEDTTFHRVELDWTGVTWAALTNGTTTIAGALLYQRISASDGDNVPIAFYNDGCPINPGGEDFFFQTTTNGGLHL